MSELFSSNGQGGSVLSMIFMFGSMFAILYFVLIRPQQKQQKRHQELVASLKKGDEVVLTSGIIGRIFSVEDKFMVLELADKNKMKVLRHAVQGIYTVNSPTTAPESK